MSCPLTGRPCDCAPRSIKHRACIEATRQTIRNLERDLGRGPDSRWKAQAKVFRDRLERA